MQIVRQFHVGGGGESPSWVSCFRFRPFPTWGDGTRGREKFGGGGGGENEVVWGEERVSEFWRLEIARGLMGVE